VRYRAGVHTFVPFAEMITRLRNASFFGPEAKERPAQQSFLEDPRRITTPLKLDEWEKCLIECNLYDKHQHLLPLIRDGFPMDCHWTLLHSIIHPNHASANQYPSVIQDYILSKQALQRYSEFYTREELEAQIGFFYCPPLGSVPKGNKPDARRIIQDNTFPRKTALSLNSHLESQNDKVSWTTFAEVVKLVTAAPDGARGGGIDGEAAYRMCATRIEDQKWTVIQWRGKFAVDRCKHFGEKNGGVPHGMVAGAVVDMIEAKLPTVCGGKWADDFFFIQHPLEQDMNGFRYECELDGIIQITDRLGYKTKREKDQTFASTFSFIGFSFELDTKSIWLLEEKRAKYAERLDDLLKRFPVWWTVSEAQKITGNLAHIQIVVHGGRAHTQSLWADLATMEGHDLARGTRTKAMEERKYELSGRSVLNMRWWAEVLRQQRVGMAIRVQPEPSAEFSVFTDASDNGIGVVINEEWDMWRLTGKWRDEGRDIGWAEAVAVEFAVRILLRSFNAQGKHLRIRCDNMGVVEGWKKGSSRSVRQNEILLSILEMILEHDCWLSLEYIPSSQNPADNPSRGKAAQGRRAQEWKIANSWPEQYRHIITKM
jgi:hypothetical protein